MNINDLYKNARNGNKSDEEQLFETLSVRFRLFVYQRTNNEEEAKEIVQEAMITIINGYRDIEFETSFLAWAYNVLKNKLLNHFRKKQYRINKLATEKNTDQFSSWNPNPELESKIMECFKELSKGNLKYARVLNMKYQGYKAEDICKKMNITSNNLYVILSRARSLMKSCLEKKGVK